MPFNETQAISVFTTLIDYQGGTNPVYIGKAQPNVPSGAAAWQIKRLTYDTNNNVTLVQYANGSTDFINIWDNRLSIPFS